MPFSGSLSKLTTDCSTLIRLPSSAQGARKCPGGSSRRPHMSLASNPPRLSPYSSCPLRLAPPRLLNCRSPAKNDVRSIPRRPRPSQLCDLRHPRHQRAHALSDRARGRHRLAVLRGAQPCASIQRVRQGCRGASVSSCHFLTPRTLLTRALPPLLWSSRPPCSMSSHCSPRSKLQPLPSPLLLPRSTP